RSETGFRSVAKDKENDSTLLVTTEKGKKYLADIRLKKVSEEFDSFSTFSGYGLNEKSLVTVDKKYGVTNYTGKPLLACEWDTIINYYTKYVLVKNSKYFLADTSFIVNKNIAADTIRS